MSTNFNPYLQHNGTFQLKYFIADLFNFQTVSKKVWLNGLYKIRLTGIGVCSQIQTETVNHPATIDTGISALDSYSNGHLLSLTSPQMLNQVTEDTGFLVPCLNTNLVNTPEVQEVTDGSGGTGTNTYLTTKNSFLVGDVLNNWVAVNFSSNRIDFQAGLYTSTTNQLVSLNSVEGWGTSCPDGWILLTFQYESLKA